MAFAKRNKSSFCLVSGFLKFSSENSGIFSCTSLFCIVMGVVLIEWFALLVLVGKEKLAKILKPRKIDIDCPERRCFVFNQPPFSQLHLQPSAGPCASSPSRQWALVLLGRRPLQRRRRQRCRRQRRWLSRGFWCGWWMAGRYRWR